MVDRPETRPAQRLHHSPDTPFFFLSSHSFFLLFFPSEEISG
jgi:hypothetical protein